MGWLIGAHLQRRNRVECLVHRRARQVVHGGIDDAEVLCFAGFEVQHLRHAQAGVADQRASRLDDELALAKTACVDFGQQLCPQRVGGGRRVAVVVDAQAAAKVDVVDGNAGRFNAFDQVEHAVGSVQVRRGFGDLRADMAVDADHAQAGQAGGALVYGQRALMGNAEFIAL